MVRADTSRINAAETGEKTFDAFLALAQNGGGTNSYVVALLFCLELPVLSISGRQGHHHLAAQVKRVLLVHLFLLPVPVHHPEAAMLRMQAEERLRHKVELRGVLLLVQHPVQRRQAGESICKACFVAWRTDETGLARLYLFPSWA